MKNRTIKGIIFLGSCVPYAFGGLWGIANNGSSLFLWLSFICIVVLCYLTIRCHAFGYAIAGSILSAIVSYFCVLHYATKGWTRCFESVSPESMVVNIAVAVLLIHGSTWFIIKGSRADKGDTK